jgi:hypothetical protein
MRMDEAVLRKWFIYQANNPYAGRMNAVFIEFLFIKNHRKFHETYNSNLYIYYKTLCTGVMKRIGIHKSVKKAIQMMSQETAKHNKNTKKIK